MYRRVSGKSGQEGEVTNSVEEQALESIGVEETGLPTDLSEVGHSSTLAWKIPWMEEPGRLQSMGSLRVGHD